MTVQTIRTQRLRVGDRLLLVDGIGAAETAHEITAVDSRGHLLCVHLADREPAVLSRGFLARVERTAS